MGRLAHDEDLDSSRCTLGSVHLSWPSHWFLKATPALAKASTSFSSPTTTNIGRSKTCPLIAKILAKHHGFRCTVLFGVDESGAIKAGGAPVPGMEALEDADLLFFFTRFMNLPDEQADQLVAYFERGGPAVGIRTSTHCFNGQKGKWEKLNFNYKGDDYVGGLGQQVFGNTWEKVRGQSHYGSNHQAGGRVTPVASAKGHPILSGVKQIHAYSGAYKSQPPCRCDTAIGSASP